jgi:hypothetical protein
MVRKLDTFPETRRVKQPDKYPWDEWLDGSIYELTKGTDYSIKTVSIRSNAQAKAKERGGRLRYAMPSPDVLVIQFIPNHTGTIKTPSERTDRG